MHLHLLAIVMTALIATMLALAAVHEQESLPNLLDDARAPTATAPIRFIRQRRVAEKSLEDESKSKSKSKSKRCVYVGTFFKL